MKILTKCNDSFKVLLCHISPKALSKYLYHRTFKKRLNLENPVGFNEKLMWLKLKVYNNNPVVWQCSDKYHVREFVKSCGISEDHLPKLINTYLTPEEIDYNKLPKKFALKCSHGCGFNIICQDKKKLNQKETNKKLRKWLKTKFGYKTAETHYMHIKPRIICEEFIENQKGEFPIDYKLYCFNGKPKLVLVCVDRKEHYQTAFYDMEWNRVHLRDNETKKEISKPASLDEMVEIAKKVTKDFPFVRVDFYEYKGKAILGEMTFTPAACLASYTDKAMKDLGDMLSLEGIKK